MNTAEYPKSDALDMLDHADNKLRVAILDLYDGVTNQGMRCIKEILTRYGVENCIEVEVNIFEVRGKNQIPDLNFDVYISTGGPGSPIDSREAPWDIAWCSFMDSIFEYNKNPKHQKKHVFLICHSFQLFCRHLHLGLVSKRKSPTFGTFPVFLTEDGKLDQITGNVADPFYVVDSRDWQVTLANEDRFREVGAKLLAIEKDRPHIPLERAVMAIRFSPEIIGTQFHPEADPFGMSIWMQTDSKKAEIIENHSESKYFDMLLHLNDPDKILLTQRMFIPVFLDEAVARLNLVDC